MAPGSVALPSTQLGESSFTLQSGVLHWAPITINVVIVNTTDIVPKIQALGFIWNYFSHARWCWL